MKSQIDKRKKKPEQKTQYLSTDIELLNLALTGKLGKGFSAGSYSLLVGGSAAGKTWLLLQVLAAAANDPAFDKYDLRYTGPERGEQKIDLAGFFGPKLAKRIKVSRTSTLEDWYKETIGHFKERPTIECLDSMDALVPREAAKIAEGSSEKGSYGTEKARINSSRIRVAHINLAAHGSILLIVSQSRQNLGFGATFNPDTRSGGTALTFYADAEVWFKVKGKIKQTVLGKPRTVGTVLKVTVKKNRDTGNVPSVELHHFRKHGFADLYSAICWLVDEKVWEGKKSQSGVLIKVEAPEFKWSGSPEKLVTQIQERGEERELHLLLAERWAAIEEASKMDWKKRYA